MVESFCDDPTAFSRVVQYHAVAIAMGYFKACEWKLHERGYTILKDVYEPRNKKLVVDVSLSFHQLDSIAEGTM